MKRIMGGWGGTHVFLHVPMMHVVMFHVLICVMYHCSF